MSWFLGIFRLLRKIDTLLQLEAMQRTNFDAVNKTLVDLEKRISRIENREDVVVNEAKSAARTGAQDIMTGFAADLVRRITLLEAASPTPRLSADAS